MKTAIIALNSDTVNRYGSRFALSGLELSIRDNYGKGIPMLIGHDQHRTYGWNIPFALYFEPKITRVLGKQVTAETDEEFRRIVRAHENFLDHKICKAWEPHEEPFLKLIDQHLSEDHLKIDAGCVAVYQKGIAGEIFADIFTHKDDVGLISLNKLLEDFNYLGQGLFLQKESKLILFAHTYFRRTQSIYNNFHFYFLDELLSLKDNQDITIKLCLSEDVVGYGPSHHTTMELEYHWGPKFSDDISSIKHGIARHECDEFQRAFYGISRSEFYWKRDENEMTFEMEELRDKPCPFEKEETYHCRYVHSIYNSDLNEFVHFDGAIRTYDLEEMSDRLDKNFVEYGRKASYKKLFRIDGKLPLHLWKLLTVHYQQGNPLIYEYFGLDEERDLQKLQPRKLPPEKELLPYSIEKEDGIRLLVSYHIPEEVKEGRYIDLFDIMGTSDEKFECLENLVHEVRKSLLKLGHDIEIPEHVKMLKIMDRYWNIPSIMHTGPNLTELLKVTIIALANLFEAIIDGKRDMDISFTLGFMVADRIVKVSSYGNIQNQLMWMKEQLPFPTDENGFSKWVVAQKKYISQFQEKSDDPLIISLVQGDGVLYIKRTRVDLDHEIEEDEHGISYKVQLPSDSNKLLELIEQNKVEASALLLVHEGKWSDTGEDYHSSSRSKFLDDHDNAGVMISKWEPLGLYWTRT